MDLTLRRLFALRKLPKPCLRQRLRRWECGAWECALEGALVTSTASLIGAFMRRVCKAFVTAVPTGSGT